MTAAIFLEEQLEIPTIRSLSDFRRWAMSERFPERGRVDFIAGCIEVDMSPEDLFRHGTPKTELIRVLAGLVKAEGLGELLSDRSRVTCPAADLSAEPDLVFVSEQSLEHGRVRLVPKVGTESDRYIEIEGAPDLTVEIVSDSTVRKDTVRLPRAYWQAGVREFWLVDARRERLIFRIHRRGKSGWLVAKTDAEGFQASRVLGCRFRLTRRRRPQGRWIYDLDMA
jgi:Uma2 family endonuclease